MADNGCGAKINTFDDCRAQAPVAAAVLPAPTAQRPYIKLNPKYPGIVAGFMYDMENAKNLSAMGQTIMRRPGRSLTPGERELIFAYTSRLNECEFCAQSHEACAAEFLHKDLVDEVVNQHDFEQITPKLQALLNVAGAVQALDRDRMPTAVEGAKLAGANDQEIHDTVLVASFGAMCNRYVDGLGTTFLPGEPQEGGKGLAKYGYTMTIRRFFGEVLPKLWASFRGR